MSSNERTNEGGNEAAKDAGERDHRGYGRHHGHHHHRHGRRWFWKIPFIIAAIVALKGGLVFLLWNALVPDLFHGPVVTFGQAAGLVVLAKLLFAGKHFGGPFGGGFGGRFGRGAWKERWMSMTPEEREKARDQIRKHWRG